MSPTEAVIGQPPTPQMTFSEILAGARREEQARIEAHEAQARQARQDAAQARITQVKSLKGQMDSLLAQYEEQRNALRQTFHELHELEQRLSVVSSGQVSHLPPQLATSNVPSAFPGPNEPLYAVVPSFQLEVMHFQQTRQWPKK